MNRDVMPMLHAKPAGGTEVRRDARKTAVRGTDGKGAARGRRLGKPGATSFFLPVVARRAVWSLPTSAIPASFAPRNSREEASAASPALNGPHLQIAQAGEGVPLGNRHILMFGRLTN
jgi:hypothetical protein